MILKGLEILWSRGWILIFVCFTPREKAIRTQQPSVIPNNINTSLGVQCLCISHEVTFQNRWMIINSVFTAQHNCIILSYASKMQAKNNIVRTESWKCAFRCMSVYTPAICVQIHHTFMWANTCCSGAYLDCFYAFFAASKINVNVSTLYNCKSVFSALGHQQPVCCNAYFNCRV